MGWTVEARRGTAHELHHWDPARPARRVVVCEVTAPALVLGSTQPDVVVAGAAVPVVRRRSGGGAVLVAPGAQLWVEVFVPPGDGLWTDDVEAATWWLGSTWAAAFGAHAAGPVTVHRRGVSDRGLGRVACFAAAGPGEVLVGGAKALGVSQRRTRTGARFQCLVCGPDRQQGVVPLLDPAAQVDPVGLVTALDRVLGWDAGERSALLARFIRHLPA